MKDWQGWIKAHWRALAFGGAALLLLVGLVALDRALSNSELRTLVTSTASLQPSPPEAETTAADLESLRAAATEAQALLVEREAQRAEEERAQALRDEVLTTMEDWKQAWVAQDAGAYLSFYATDFDTPFQISREEWASFRISRIQNPRWIRVEFEQLDFVQLEENFAAISFTQLYAAPGYADRSRKHMDLVRTEQGWKIRREDAVDTVRLE